MSEDPCPDDLAAFFHAEQQRPPLDQGAHDRLYARLAASLPLPPTPPPARPPPAAPAPAEPPAAAPAPTTPPAGPSAGSLPPGPLPAGPAPPPATPVAMAAPAASWLSAKPLLLVALAAAGAATGVAMFTDRAPAPAPPAPAIEAPAPCAEPPAAAPPEPSAPAPHASAAPTHPPVTPAARDADLVAERALLDDARAALRRGQPAACIDALGRHARDYPRGRLGEEREALWIRALIAAGRRDEARSRLARFRRNYPRSLNLPALEAALP